MIAIHDPGIYTKYYLQRLFSLINQYLEIHCLNFSMHLTSLNQVVCKQAYYFMFLPYYGTPLILSHLLLCDPSSLTTHPPSLWLLPDSPYFLTSPWPPLFSDTSSLPPPLLPNSSLSQVPPLPEHYSTELGSLMSSMLEQEPEDRPTVSDILHQKFIRAYIQIFIKRNRLRPDKLYIYYYTTTYTWWAGVYHHIYTIQRESNQRIIYYVNIYIYIYRYFRPSVYPWKISALESFVLVSFALVSSALVSSALVSYTLTHE